MSAVALLGLLLATAAAPLPAKLPGASVASASPRFCDVPAERITPLLAELKELPRFESRLLSASERFLGTRYVRDPLGEGRGNLPDEDPPLRFEAVDCLTYVETVMAIALSPGPDGLLEQLNRIRYDGAPTYANRNHFFEAHWLAANARKGLVVDATERIAGADAVAHTKTVRREDWERRKSGGAIRLPAQREPTGEFRLNYVPLDRLAAVAPRIPSGTVFAVVRADRPQMPSMVSHVGFIVQTARGPVARHAGLDLYRQVVDEDLAHFVQRCRRMRKWRVLGLQLLQVVPPQASPIHAVHSPGPETGGE